MLKKIVFWGCTAFLSVIFVGIVAITLSTHYWIADFVVTEEDERFISAHENYLTAKGNYYEAFTKNAVYHFYCYFNAKQQYLGVLKIKMDDDIDYKYFSFDDDRFNFKSIVIFTQDEGIKRINLDLKDLNLPQKAKFWQHSYPTLADKNSFQFKFHTLLFLIKQEFEHWNDSNL